MGLLPDTQNCGLRMSRECREHFPSHRLQRKPLVSDPVMHHGTCVTHVPWCMSGSLNRGGGENVPGIPGTCATHNFTYLARGPRTYSTKPTLHRNIHCWQFQQNMIHFVTISPAHKTVESRSYVPRRLGLALLTLSWDKNIDNQPWFSNAASDWLPAELPANQKPH